jgi:hypothetical protein
MLTKKEIEIFAAIIGKPADEIEKAIKDEKEVSLGIKAPYKVFVTEDDLESDDHVDRLRKEKYDEALKVQSEKTAKELKRLFEIDIVGKDLEKVVPAIKEKILKDANVVVDEKVKAIQTDLEKARTEYERQLQEKDQLIQTKEGELKKVTFNSLLDGIIPVNGLKIDREDAKVLVTSRLQFDTIDGKVVVMKDGQVLKDKTRKEVEPKAAIIDLLSERGYYTPEGKSNGSGGNGSKSAAGIGKMSELMEYYQSNGINPNGAQAKAILQEVTKDNANFAFSE